MIELTRRRVSFRLLALVSLGLNLFLGAMLVSAYQHQEPARGLAMPDRLVERVAPDLPAADAERLRRTFTAKRAQFAVLEEDYRQATLRVRAAAAREPLDLEELRALMDTARAARRRIGDLVEETVLSLLPDLSLSARERLVAGRR